VDGDGVKNDQDSDMDGDGVANEQDSDQDVSFLLFFVCFSNGANHLICLV
jgi:hypothetical protein